MMLFGPIVLLSHSLCYFLVSYSPNHYFKSSLMLFFGRMQLTLGTSHASNTGVIRLEMHFFYIFMGAEISMEEEASVNFFTDL
jgi:hypothetical protein